MTRTSALLGWGGIALIVLGATLALALMLGSPDSLVRRKWAEYEGWVDREVRFMLLKTTGSQIARIQLAVFLVLVAAAYALDEFVLWMLVPVVALGPGVWLRQRHDQRVHQIEVQIDTWLLTLANALKATPSLGEALAASAGLIRAPLADEIHIAMKETRLGSPIDQALLNMGIRVGSRALSGTIATLLIARQTGGDLSRILEDSAASLREMARLEGVVRAKTAEGKAQAWVLGAIPFLLTGTIHLLDPNWLVPLTESTTGYMILGIALALWVSAILIARKVLAVDV